MKEWFYQGPYGQIGPVSLAQIKELADLGGITPETYIWSEGMDDWQIAKLVPEIADFLPVTPPSPPSTPNSGLYFNDSSIASGAFPHLPQSDLAGYRPSRKSRYLAALLNFFLPGVGRLYLGFIGLGLAQFFTAFICIGFFWSWIDSFSMLFGLIPFDGAGNRLT